MFLVDLQTSFLDSIGNYNDSNAAVGFSRDFPPNIFKVGHLPVICLVSLNCISLILCQCHEEKGLAILQSAHAELSSLCDLFSVFCFTYWHANWQAALVVFSLSMLVPLVIVIE